jgi:hypothetical protein
MATQRQRKAARENIKKAARAAKRKHTIAHLSKATRTALGKQGGQAETNFMIRGEAVVVQGPKPEPK